MYSIYSLLKRKISIAMEFGRGQLGKNLEMPGMSQRFVNMSEGAQRCCATYWLKAKVGASIC